jgi:CheY-like chemotaxis protein
VPWVAANGRKGSGVGPIRRDNILLIDDEEDIREAVREVLEDHGYCVRVASNGKEALEFLVKREVPSLILLDLNMPEMDGFEFLKEIRKKRDLAKIPVLVLTASGEKSRFAKVEGVITKPIELEVLLGYVEKYCASEDET